MVRRRRAGGSLLMHFLATAAGVAVGIVAGTLTTVGVLWVFVTLN